MSPLSNWIKDEAFICEALAEARKHDCVSLDIFDTALTRLVDSPADAFAEIEKRLVVKFGSAANGFATAREEAERESREHARSLNYEEVTLNEIYKFVPRYLPKFSQLVDAIALEMETERDLLFAVPDILELTGRLKASNIPYMFVSDMYHSAAFLAEILGNAGFSGWTAIHVSSEVKASKASGRIWQAILPLGMRIVHIGDDEKSDVEMPKSFGLTTMAYTRASSSRRAGSKLTPDILPFSYRQRSLELSARSNLKPLTDVEQWQLMGRGVGTIVVGSFIEWLRDRLEAHEIDRLYFCARDGWLIKAAWEAAGFSTSVRTKIHYLGVSRRTLHFACGYIDSSPGRLSEPLIKFLSSSDRDLSIWSVLQRLGCAEDSMLCVKAKIIFGDLQQTLKMPEIYRMLLIFLQSNSALVRGRLSKDYSNLLQYLRQEKLLSPGRVAIVDLGWHGTMQKSLKKILDHCNSESELTGFYYGLWPAATGNRYGAGPMEAAFSTDYLEHWEQPEMEGAVEILEELHSAPHGTVISYEHRNSRWEPVFANSTSEAEQFRMFAEPFHQGVLQGICERKISSDKAVDDYYPKAAIAAIGASFLSPTADELALISQLQHSGSFDHANFDPIVIAETPKNSAAMKADLERSQWRAGTLQKWIRAANNEQRRSIAELARQRFSHWSARTLRQYD
ncbi:hypothetical protein [Phyllobacterium sp. YR531]|uniref:hypothetical protein n=1 Tax=Phyllobacterium sp. YR531 TaxID=1144343 RepID=UPI00026F49E9|nr:hypothetical protein [Phyllobacterium sp. YR531]EJM99949.1 putative hydrolase (HAD superfamily) [Phyllobacterium sp. YR531]